MPPGSRVLDELFMEYLKVGGNWMCSSIVCKVENSVEKIMKGEEHYVRLCDLRSKEGDEHAEEIYRSKLALQESLPEDSPEAPFVLKHPDLPGCKASVEKRVMVIS